MQYIDLRSDTVTVPTDEMREAMATCEVGDDVYGDDPTTNKLEKLAADTMGKEAALFVPSGAMGNQISVMTHTNRGDEIIAGEKSHIPYNEQAGAAVLSSVSYKLIMNENEFVYASDVKRSIRDDSDIHYPHTGLICLENALSNGRVVPVSIMKEVYEVAREHKIPVHLDGARVFNAAVSLGVPVTEITKYADSVNFCVSKGLCAPVGALLCGTNDFIKKARRNRKLLGGGMRQVGILAACGIIGIEKMSKRLNIDHENAKYFARQLQTIQGVKVDPSVVEINMIFFQIEKDGFDHDGFVNFMMENNVKINGQEYGDYRYVTHNEISKADIDTVIKLMKDFI